MGIRLTTNIAATLVSLTRISDSAVVASSVAFSQSGSQYVYTYSGTGEYRAVVSVGGLLVTKTVSGGGSVDGDTTEMEAMLDSPIGSDAVYTTAAGSVISLRAIYSPKGTAEVQGVPYPEATLLILKSDVDSITGGRDTVVVEGHSHTVISILPETDALTWHLQLG